MMLLLFAVMLAALSYPMFVLGKRADLFNNDTELFENGDISA